MKVEFTKCNKLPINEDTMRYLRKQGKEILLQIDEKVKVWNSEKFKYEPIHRQYVTLLRFVNPSVTLLSHDILYFENWKDCTIIGYCALEFSEEMDVRL